MCSLLISANIDVDINNTTSEVTTAPKKLGRLRDGGRESEENAEVQTTESSIRLADRTVSRAREPMPVPFFLRKRAAKAALLKIHKRAEFEAFPSRANTPGGHKQAAALKPQFKITPAMDRKLGIEAIKRRAAETQRILEERKAIRKLSESRTKTEEPPSKFRDFSEQSAPSIHGTHKPKKTHRQERGRAAKEDMETRREEKNLKMQNSPSDALLFSIPPHKNTPEILVEIFALGTRGNSKQAMRQPYDRVIDSIGEPNCFSSPRTEYALTVYTRRDELPVPSFLQKRAAGAAFSTSTSEPSSKRPRSTASEKLTMAPTSSRANKSGGRKKTAALKPQFKITPAMDRKTRNGSDQETRCGNATQLESRGKKTDEKEEVEQNDPLRKLPHESLSSWLLRLRFNVPLSEVEKMANTNSASGIAARTFLRQQDAVPSLTRARDVEKSSSRKANDGAQRHREGSSRDVASKRSSSRKDDNSASRHREGSSRDVNSKKSSSREGDDSASRHRAASALDVVAKKSSSRDDKASKTKKHQNPRQSLRRSLLVLNNAIFYLHESSRKTSSQPSAIPSDFPSSFNIFPDCLYQMTFQGPIKITTKKCVSEKEVVAIFMLLMKERRQFAHIRKIDVIHTSKKVGRLRNGGQESEENAEVQTTESSIRLADRTVSRAREPIRVDGVYTARSVVQMTKLLQKSRPFRSQGNSEFPYCLRNKCAPPSSKSNKLTSKLTRKAPVRGMATNHVTKTSRRSKGRATGTTRRTVAMTRQASTITRQLPHKITPRKCNREANENNSSPTRDAVSTRSSSRTAPPTVPTSAQNAISTKTLSRSKDAIGPLTPAASARKVVSKKAPTRNMNTTAPTVDVITKRILSRPKDAVASRTRAASSRVVISTSSSARRKTAVALKSPLVFEKFWINDV
ncbi:unnamed protein product [Caenorhabditis auriculariae]|uniref:Uncharacterized protein n=1 Tax=Caenorhabditis auriculariae TaxID=2777116 RepID=A0A8S1H1E5_9PELO|nr:unnamed protein product [Caenorhabditis auriculariae]